ncbi:hypothetical protein ABMY20_12750 [Tenacibaculum sp. SSH1-16]|uniref:hypothetical protein n=1 Tax=Tenacibaculum sp. SSH1-16 TaxID=3136667 RepID=UPI0032C478E3
MSKQEKFNSKEELNTIINIFRKQSHSAEPSEVLEFLNEVEGFVVKLHQMGFAQGYEKGVQFKEEIEDNLK